MTVIKIDSASAARELLARRMARRQLIDFIKYNDSNYIADDIHIIIAAALDKFLQDVADKKSPRLMIHIPPRHGKSQMASRMFPAYVLGRYPDFAFIGTSYSADLAISLSRDVQRIIDNDRYIAIFPDTRINGKNVIGNGAWKRTADEFEIVDHRGVYKCAGVEGGITGRGGNILLIDDPVKDFAEAQSETRRSAVWNWYTSTLRTRLESGGGIIIIQTLWHVEDLSGKLLSEQMRGGEKWTVLNFPAIAEKDESFRKAGEALSPKRISIDDLTAIKNSVGEYVWAALFQQRPTKLGGNIIKGSWFGRYIIPPKIIYRKIFADTAQKTSEHNDYSVFECFGKGEDGKLYLLDILRGKWEAHELKQRASDFWKKHSAMDVNKYGVLREMVVEDKSSGTGLIQDLKREAKIPIIGVQRTKDKMVRLNDVISYIQSGYVIVPESALYVSDFLYECETFTATDKHAHDDQIDPLIDAINDMLADREDMTMPSVRVL